MAEEWQTQKFRQSVVAKINEAIQSSAMDPNKNGTVMENHVFKKARSREDYLSLVAKLILHVREMNKNKSQPQSGDSGVNNIMPDPINALQNLASQGTRTSQMMAMTNQNNQISSGSVSGNNIAASNLLQTLTQQRPGQQLQNMQSIRGQLAVPMGGNIPQSNMNPAAINNQIGNSLGNLNSGMNINVTQMQNQNSQLGNCLSGQINPMPPNQMQMNPNLQTQSINPLGNVSQIQINSLNPNQINMGMNHQQLNQMLNRLNTNPSLNVVSNAVNQVSMTNQINVTTNMPPQPQINSTGVTSSNQVGIIPNTGQINSGIMNIQNMPQKNQNIIVNNGGNIFQGNRNVNQNQFLRQSPSPTIASPAGINQSHPNPQMIPSPALVQSSSPQMPNILTGNQRNALRQSPSGSLNTPGQITNSSPFNPQEDQMYREKYKQLTKYIEPLKRMVAKIGNDDVEKIMKMNKLLEILCNPHQRIPLETLLKCEKALEKMDFKSCLFVSSTNQFGSNNPLFEAVSAAIQNPIGNHTLQRSFRPCLEALFGTDIKNLPPAAKQIRLAKEEHNNSNSDIPHVLQGEIARLDQKFKVSIDTSSQNNNRMIKLVCCLDDKRLPCVPPVSVCIPEDYPLNAPNCSLMEQEYLATPFLVAVQEALIARITKLPKCYSLSHLLDTWEMSVRQACSSSFVTPSEISTLLGV